MRAARGPSAPGRRAALSLAGLVFAAGVLLDRDLGAAPDAPARPDPAVFDEVWQKVKGGFYDPKLHGVDWDAIGKKYRARVAQARTQRELHLILDEMFGELHASHLAMIEGDYYKPYVLADAVGKVVPRYGMSLTHLDGKDEGFYVSRVLPGSAADAAGVRRGDRVLAIDGLPPHPRLLLPKPYETMFGGPRSYVIPAQTGSVVHLVLQRTRRPLGRFELRLAAHPWNEIEAGRHGARIIERAGFKLGYFHVYHLLDAGPVSHLHRFLVRHGAELDGMLVDLRGTGGLPQYADQIVDFFDKHRVGRAARRADGRWVPPSPSAPFFGKPAVALIDESARSVKEVLAFQWRRKKVGLLVGRTTRGAVLGTALPKAEKPLSDGSYVFVPMFDVRPLSGGVTLEGYGVPPDVAVENALPYADGRDEVVEAGVEALLEQVLAARRVGKRSGWY
ncbi:MAG: S41 family peptidase [Planctomycetota bacterium]